MVRFHPRVNSIAPRKNLSKPRETVGEKIALRGQFGTTTL